MSVNSKQRCGMDGGQGAPRSHRCECVMLDGHEEEWHGCRCGALWSECPWCPPRCPQCVGDRDCECYTHQDDPAPVPPATTGPADETEGLAAHFPQTCTKALCYPCLHWYRAIADRADRIAREGQA